MGVLGHGLLGRLLACFDDLGRLSSVLGVFGVLNSVGLGSLKWHLSWASLASWVASVFVVFGVLSGVGLWSLGRRRCLASLAFWAPRSWTSFAS
jgi:hypothetical protein